MIIKTYPIGIYEENIYVLVDEKSKDACIVDPGGNGDLLIKNIEELGCNIKYILLTHGHFDHVEALNEVVERFKAPVYMNENEVNFMKTDKTVFGNIPEKYNLLKDGDTLFKGSVGRSDFIGGDFNELINSIKTKLMILDNDINVYPGHMESSTIGYEKLRNPFLQDEFEIF